MNTIPSSLPETLSRYGFGIVCCYAEVGSTMYSAKELIPEVSSSKKPALVMALSQTKGRGRQGRSWIAAQSGLYVTYVFPLNKPVNHLVGFSLAVGVAVAEELDKSSKKLLLKWPNDLMLATGAGKPVKCGGILIEVNDRIGQEGVSIGIGINLTGAPSDAAALSDVGLKFSPEEAAALVSPAVIKAFNTFVNEGNGLAPFCERWTKRAVLPGRTVEIDIGGRTVSGKCTGISANGALLLATDKGEYQATSGHIISW